MSKDRRVITISCCEECPKFVPGTNTCMESDEREIPIEELETIPDWCPLETVQEYCESNFDIGHE